MSNIQRSSEQGANKDSSDSHKNENKNRNG